MYGLNTMSTTPLISRDTCADEIVAGWLRVAMRPHCHLTFSLHSSPD